jgi:hypothetical protein
MFINKIIIGRQLHALNLGNLRIDLLLKALNLLGHKHIDIIKAIVDISGIKILYPLRNEERLLQQIYLFISFLILAEHLA